ncbi:MAG: aminotransferase class III-fold pyridoxal phosphate-dependent enzyme [Anaerolineae bacterium]|nr:aminotransferase class III-fold pyridoxal phosphate-dependent enzyme [Anaerolineae bacterium]
MSIQGKKTRELFQKAKAVMPYGVNSNFRYWGEDDTLIATRGEGTYIWDADGKRYIDYRLGFGPIILGHGHPVVVKRVQDAIQDGTVFAWTTPYEIDLCERITKMCNVDKVRLTNTGTEATMHALRIARAYTGREKFIKFEGQYHGMADYFMYSTASANPVSLGSKRSPINVPATSGIPKGINQYVINLPYNDFERLEETITAQWGDIAAIFVEPMLGNSAGVMPLPGYLQKMRELCDKYGIVLVFDEVKTGFRMANGGAQAYFNIQADLVTYAKSLGNGFPIAAIAGKEDVMMTIEPGLMAHGGTYSGNVVGTVAAIATLEILETEPIIETIFKRGEALMTGIGEILTESDIPYSLPGVPSMFGIVLGVEEEPHDFREYFQGDGELYEKLALELIKRGVQPDGDAREPWFLCAALSEEDVSETLNVFNDALKAAKA